MGGATRVGCIKLNAADNEVLKTCFAASKTEDGKDVCTHCNAYKVLSKTRLKGCNTLRFARHLMRSVLARVLLPSPSKVSWTWLFWLAMVSMATPLLWKQQVSNGSPTFFFFATIDIIMIARIMFICCFYSSYNLIADRYSAGSLIYIYWLRVFLLIIYIYIIVSQIHNDVFVFFCSRRKEKGQNKRRRYAYTESFGAHPEGPSGSMGFLP
jgi:hypothetical protein